MVLSKRLGEMNEELKKSETRNSNLSAELEKSKNALKSEETKSSQLLEQMKQLESCSSKAQIGRAHV